MDKEYIEGLRKLCDEKEIHLIFDEVQTGTGRCGEWYCQKLYGVEPDIFTSEKALGGGVPIGAIGAKAFVAENEGLVILETDYAVEDYAIAVKKGNTELLDDINDALKALIADGTIDGIIGKYIKAE